MPVHRIASLFGFFAILITICIYSFGKESKSFDQDCYTRLNLVERFQQTGNWYDNTLPRDNPQHPETTQWSRLLDVIIVSGGWVLGNFIGIKAGIWWWAALVSPIFLALGCAAIAWAGKPLLPDRERILTALLYILQPSIVTYSMFARPDHHGLLILLMTLSMGGMIKLLAETEIHPPTAILAALSQSLAMAISVEALVSTGLSYLVLGICWLVGQPNIARKAAWYSLGIATWSALLYIAAIPPSRWNAQELDRVSLVHLAVFLTVCIFWWLASRRQIKQRLLTGFFGAAIVFGVAELLNPNFILGPTANINPVLKDIWFSHIQEYHHLYTPLAEFPAQLILWLFLALPAIPWCVHKIRQTEREIRDIWIYLLAINITFSVLAAVQVRWTLYAEAVALIPATNLAFAVMDILCSRVREKFHPAARCTVILLLTIGNLPLGLVLLPKNSPSLATTTLPNSARLVELCNWLNTQSFASENQVIAANCNFGSEIVYRTPFSIIATGSHRNSDGILYIHHLFTSELPEETRRLLLDKQITLILITANSIDAPMVNLSDKSFYHLLQTNQLPPWIKPVPLPGKLAKSYRLFQFTHS